MTSTGVAVDPDDKIPKTFAHCATQIDVYNNRLLDGKKRRFLENMLAGAESLARVWHEHTKTKACTPISLGEILQKRLFTASGDVNPLTLPRQGSSATAGQALRLVNGEVVSGQWAPRSLLAIIDGVDAARWALILVEVGKEEDINAFADWFVAKARSNPTKLDQVKRLWLEASWAIALGMRAGKTFKEMAAEVVADTAMVNEAMAYVEPAPKRNPANGSTNDDDFQPNAPRRARGGNRQYRRRNYDDDYRGGQPGSTGHRADDRDDWREDRRDDRRGDRGQDWRRGGGKGYRQQYQQWTHDDDGAGGNRGGNRRGPPAATSARTTAARDSAGPRQTTRYPTLRPSEFDSDSAPPTAGTSSSFPSSTGSARRPTSWTGASGS